MALPGAIRRHPLASFFILACALTWPCVLLARVSLGLAVLGLAGPALAAHLVLAATQGRNGVAALWRRFLVPVSLGWPAAALLLPLALMPALWALHRLSGEEAPLRLAPITPLTLVLALLILGEEMGWRGYALPALLAQWPPVAGSLVLGLLWGLWHLPNFLMPGFPHHELPFGAFLALTTAYSFVFTWFFLRTRGSLLVAVLLHAGLNLFALAGVDPSLDYWLRAALYGAVALVAALAGGFRLPLARGPAGPDAGSEV